MRVEQTCTHELQASLLAAVELPEQIEQFENEVERVVTRFRQEYSLPYACMVGSLTIKAHELAAEANSPEEDEK